MKVSYVYQDKDADGKVEKESVHFVAVPLNGVYPTDGSDENNTFAKWTPNAIASFTITNPDLHGKFAAGDTFYVDFTPAEN